MFAICIFISSCQPTPDEPIVQSKNDGKLEQEAIVLQDEDTKEYYEEEYDGISEWIKFWRACLRRAKRYWEMDTDTLDAIQSGEKEDNEDDEE